MKKHIPQLNSLKQRSAPSSEFKKELWAELSNSYDHQYPSMIFCLRHRVAVPIAVLCLFALTGVGSYAYGSPAVNEDHMLFGVKAGMEWVQGWIHRSPDSRAEFHMRLMERRIEEGEYLLEQNAISLPHIERIDASFEQAVTSVSDTPADHPTREEMLRRLQLQQARFEYILMESIEQETESSTPEALRNVLLDFRVHIDESGLTDEEKSSLLNRHNR